MHDPMVVAFQIRRPWPKRSSGFESWGRWRFRGSFWRVAGRTYYWPSLITVWHVEPDGRDSGEVCKHYRRSQDADFKWQYKFLNGWKWHVHHWKVQVAPLQTLRRWALTRCAWCGGRSVKGARVDVSRSQDRERSPWWRGETGLFHSPCSAVESAHRVCACDEPTPPEPGRSSGVCDACGKHFAYRSNEPWKLEQRRILMAVPPGERPSAELYERACAVYRRHKEAEEATP